MSLFAQKRRPEKVRTYTAFLRLSFLKDSGFVCAATRGRFIAGIKKAPDYAEAGLLVGFILSALTARKVVISCVIVLFAGVPFLLRVFSDEH